MPHTDTNISRDALRSYGMQPARRQDFRRQEGRQQDFRQGDPWNQELREQGPSDRDLQDREQAAEGGRFKVYGDSDPVNTAKVYVDVLAEFTKDGDLRPCRITWEDGRRYMIDRIRKCERRASRKAGGMGMMYTCMICGQEVNLFYEENLRWFVTRK